MIEKQKEMVLSEIENIEYPSMALVKKEQSGDRPWDFVHRGVLDFQMVPYSNIFKQFILGGRLNS